MSLQPRIEKRCDNESCCCKCAHQIRLSLCLCGNCPAVIGGWVCDALTETPDDRMGRYMGYRRHGECELFTPIKSISSNTLKMMDEAVVNLKEGNVSEPINDELDKHLEDPCPCGTQRCYPEHCAAYQEYHKND